MGVHLLQYDALWLVLGPFVIAIAASTAAPIGYSSRAVLFVVACAYSRLFPVCRSATSALVSLSPELADDIKEGLLHVDAVLGRRFNKIAAEVFRQGLSLLRRNLAFGNAVAFVSNEHNGRLPKCG